MSKALNAKTIHLQTVADGCPGGRNGNIEASTTRSPSTPITRPLLSTTAIESFLLPILLVPAALYTEFALCVTIASISAYVVTLAPGYTSVRTIGLIALVENSCRPRRKAATAISRSRGSLSQLGLMTGLSAVSVEFIETFPRENVATRPTEPATYCAPERLALVGLPVPVPK